MTEPGVSTIVQRSTAADCTDYLDTPVHAKCMGDAEVTPANGKAEKTSAVSPKDVADVPVRVSWSAGNFSAPQLASTC